MKKYLMSGIAAFAFCAALTSCSNKEDLYDQGAIEQQKELAEREAYALLQTAVLLCDSRRGRT